MSILAGILAALVGLIAGRFFNEVIYHLPRRQPLLSRAAACLRCGEAAPALWVPILGYLRLGGRCPHCGQRLSFRLPLVEVLTALLFWLTYRQFGLSGETLFVWAFTSIVVTVSFIDLEHRLIQNKLVIAGIVLALPLSLLAGKPIIPTLLGGAAGLGLLLFIAMIYPGAMGGGDVKFALVLGLFLGWPNVLMGLLFGFVAGGLVGVVLLLLRLRRLKDMIPFGPFLAGGGLAAYWWGAQVLSSYLPWLAH